MSEPFLAEIRLFGFSFPPRSWARCDGQLLPISQNQALFSLLGTTYGGNGQNNFALPDLRGRTPLHFDMPHPLGRRDGAPVHFLQQNEMPSHTHQLQATGDSANSPGPTGNLLAQPTLSVGAIYSTTTQTQDISLGSAAVADTGGAAGHNNMQPFLTINFCIALNGLFPSQN